ncbi:MAG: hypothetical protein VCD00_05790 [Candidatus Hydrogenedentota bacterium]
MNIRSSYSKRRRPLRRFTTATLAALLCVAWAGPLHAVCACCDAMAEPVDAEVVVDADVPACHKVASEPTKKDSRLPNSTQIEAPCGDECSAVVTPPALTANLIASTIHSNITKIPMTTLARDLPLQSVKSHQFNRYESPPDITALSTQRYAVIAPLLT